MEGMPRPARLNPNLYASLSDLAAARNIAALGPLLKRFARDNGFDNSGFACLEAGLNPARPGKFTGLLDFPPAWRNRYENLSRMSTSSSDPVIRHVAKVSIPTTWDRHGHVAFTKPAIARSARELLGIAAENGLRAGLTIPLSGRNVAWSYIVLTCRHNATAQQLLPQLPEAALFAQGFMATVRRLGSEQAAPTLSARQLEILRWCAVGKTSWEISLILNLSEATVNFHLKNIAEKFGVRGRTACVGHAIARDLIAI
ncbi:MAG TPA: LuxR C-terminal-related transcriptional regulator [Rudaea sp.]